MRSSVPHWINVGAGLWSYCILLGCGAATSPANMGTAQSSHAALRTELALLQPSPLKTNSQPGSEITLLSELRSVARTLHRERLNEWGEQLFSTSTRLTPTDAQAIRETRARFGLERTRVRELFARNLPLGFEAEKAFQADYSFLEEFRAIQTLWLLEAAENLNAGEPAAAISPLVAAFEIAHKLEETPVAVLRLEAAHLRHRGWRVLHAVVNHPQANAQVARELANLAQRQLDSWSSEQSLLDQERNMGLAVYERIRRGEFESFLSQEEYERLRRESLLNVTRKSVRTHLDDDEAFYLRTMRNLLQLAEQPYYARVEQLQRIRDQLTTFSAAPDYPYVAGEFLLQDFELVQRAIATDLTECKAWWLLLRAASGDTNLQPLPVDAISGKPIVLIEEADRWQIADLESGTITAPRFTP